MKKVLVLLLAFVVAGFAAQANDEGDVLLTSIDEAGKVLKAAVTEGFAIGTRATSEVMRDIWTGSDFDADGKKEIMLASYATGGKAYVYEIDGDNSASLFFETPDFGSEITSAVRHVAYGDLDKNGMQELLVSVNSTDPAKGGLWVYEYDTVGDTMRAPVLLFGQLLASVDRWYVESFTIGDVDADGVEEIIWGNNGAVNAYDNFYIASVDSGNFASGKVRTKVEFSHGKSSTTFPAGGSPYGGVISDMDGDGHKEVLFAPWDNGALFIVEADSADHYSALNYIETDLDVRDDFAFYDFAPADLDNDGRDEVYVSMYDAGALYVITCPVGTELSALTTANVHRLEPMGGSGGVCTQIGDFDGNGRMNIYASNGGTLITVHEFNGGDPTEATNWVKLTSLTSSNFSGIYGMRYAGDLDGDGYPEIYAANTGTGTTAMAGAIDMRYDYLDLNLTFDTNADVANWSHYDETNVYTVEAWSSDSTLRLSDAGYAMVAKRPVVATPGWIYKLSVDIKTNLWAGASNVLELSVQGLGNDDVKYSCISDGVWTTYTIIGIAESDSGYIRIGGSKAGTVDTVWVDNLVWDEAYLDVYPSANIAAARGGVVGDTVATIGVVTTTTNYGTSGPVYIQDATAGIAVYNSAAAQSVALGDEILAIGKTTVYNGLLEISPVIDYFVLSKGNEVVPTIITALDMADGETYEGMLVTIQRCDTLETGLSWASTAGSNKSITLKDGNDSTFTCYIDKDTDIDGSTKPTQWPLDISGIVGDYNGAQLLPRSLADFVSSNKAPGSFTILNPADSLTITSLDDAVFVDHLIGGETLKTLFFKWSKAIDPDEGDSVTYEVVFYPEGPEESYITGDTVVYMVINEDRPWDMNGTYYAYVIAKDIQGAVAMSDTVMMTFDFPAPPEFSYADVVLVDGTPKVYATFNMPFNKVTAANFKIIDWNNGGSAADPTAVDSIAPNVVMISGTLVEDHYVSLACSGIVTPGGTVSTADTIFAGEVLIPFSANHPEDAAKIITPFEENVGSFVDPNYSGSTTGLLAASAFAVTDTTAFRGTKCGMLTLLDDPAVSGGWYLRELYGYPFTYSVKSTSKLMFLVKGTNANVEMRLSIKDTGYEQGPWTRVSVTEDDWQVVCFDLLNDDAEGWVNGNGVVEGATVVIEGIHMRCSEDADVVLYIDEFTERQVLTPVDVTFNVNMNKYVADGNFNLATDSLDVAGTFNSWSGTLMSDDNSDGIYSVVIPLMPYSRHEFKFRINRSWSDATSEFPSGGPNRVYTVGDSTNNIINYWYNDQVLIVGVDDEALLPKVFALHQNYPNPFNPITTIKYDLPKESHVKIVIYDLMGREVRTLVNAKQPAGYKLIQWNALNDFGRQVSSGYYICVMQAGDFQKNQKMILMK